MNTMHIGDLFRVTKDTRKETKWREAGKYDERMITIAPASVMKIFVLESAIM